MSLNFINFHPHIGSQERHRAPILGSDLGPWVEVHDGIHAGTLNFGVPRLESDPGGCRFFQPKIGEKTRMKWVAPLSLVHVSHVSVVIYHYLKLFTFRKSFSLLL